VTRIAPRHAIFPVVLLCALVGLGLLWSTFHAPVEAAPWAGLYPSKQWDVLKADFAHRGFAPESVHVVTGTVLTNHQRFAILGAAKDGRTCLAVARGSAIGAPICRLSKPLMLFYERDTCAPCSPPGTPPAKSLTVLGLIRGDVGVTVSSQGREQWLGGVPSEIGFAFNSSFASAKERFRAHDASGRLIASVTLPRP
jgi:hypothetical protein